jgi:DNA-binding LytR/AlgR family response regulator
MAYRCIIVDDEPIARQIIRSYIGQIPNLSCVGECKNALEALDLINADQGIEIVFLDINLPNLSGMAMARILSRPLKIIFTTAYSEFAVESYDLNAVDYLLKPFLFERFAKAVYKAMDPLPKPPYPVEPDLKESSIFIKSDGENHPVLLHEILFAEAMKNYTKVILANGKTLYPLTSISKFEEELASKSDQFLRVHRSFIISKRHIHSVGTGHVMIDTHKIPVGEQYKPHFLMVIGLPSGVK